MAAVELMAVLFSRAASSVVVSLSDSVFTFHVTSLHISASRFISELLGPIYASIRPTFYLNFLFVEKECLSFFFP